MSLGLLFFDDLIDFQDDIDILFETYNQVVNLFEPITDFYETDSSYKLLMDLPGIKKRDLRIESDAESLEIRLLNERKIDRFKSFFHLKEKSNGYLVRKIKFSEYVDPSKALINLQDGILTIIVPKTEKLEKISLTIN